MRKNGGSEHRDDSRAKEVMYSVRRFLLFVIGDKKITFAVLLLLIMLSGNIILAPMAQAAKNYSEMTPADRAKSVWYYDALKYCFQNHDIGGAVSSGGVDKGDFFTKGVGHNTTVKGAIVGNELPNGDKDFTYGCKENESEIVRNAFSLWGISPKEFLCESGIAAGSSSTGQACATSPSIVSESSAKRAAKFDNYVTNAVFGGKAPTTVSAADPEVAYIYNLKTFDNACATGKNANGNGVKIVRRQADGVSKSEVYYDINKKKTIPYSNTVSMTCKNLAASLAPDSELVNGYFAWAERENNAGNKESLQVEPSEDAEGGGDEAENACNIEGIGWIVCPVTTFLGEAADVAYGMVDGYLKIEPSLLEDDALEGAWRSFLAIANAGFIFVFIVIIYTQLTGMGSTSVGANYQLKRMLPRLLVAAVLVNLSYIICSLAVDLSNIVGANIGGLINSMSSTGTGVGAKNWAEGLGQGLVVGSLAVVAIGAGVAAIAFFLPALLSALLAILVMLLIILGRKAAVVLLIAVSPLAFLAWVLPNTGSLFQKWWKMFSAMLVLYPIIAIVFSGSKLAANIVSNTASGDDWQLQAVALAIATVPFLVIPSLLKNALNSLGTVGAKLSSITDRTAKTAGKNAKDRSKIGDYMKFRGRQADIRRAKIRSGIKPYGSLLPGGKLNPLNARRIALNGMATANNAFNKSSKTGEFGKEQHNAANRLLNELEIKEVNAAKANIERAMLDGKIDMADLAGLKELALGKSHGGIVADKYTQAEAMRQITTRGGYGDIKGMIDAVSASGDEAAIRSLGDVMATASNRPTWLQGSNLGQLQRGEGVNSEQLIDDAINSRVYSAEKIAVGDKAELADVATRAVDVKATLDPVSLQKLKDNASFAQTDSTLKAKIGKNAAEVGHLAGGTKP